MTDLQFYRHCREALEILECVDVSEAEALRLSWLMNRRFDAPAEVQPQLPLLDSQECRG